MPTLYVPPDWTSLPSWYDLGYLPSAGTYFTVGNRIYLVKAIGIVNIPVLVSIKIRNPTQQYQDRVWTFYPDESQGENLTRVFHVVDVYNTGNLAIPGGDSTGADPTQSIEVERIDSFTVFDAFNNGQQAQATLNNVDGEGTPTTPAHFFQHAATHVVRWYLTDDLGTVLDHTAFVDTELIDKLLIADVDSDGLLWQFLYTLTNNWLNVPDDSQPLGISITQNPVPANVLGY